MSPRGFRQILLLAALALPLAGCGCASTGHVVRSYPEPTADELLGALRSRQQGLGGINAETRATSWLGGERVRGTVQMLATRQGQLRFEAEVSLQGTVAALAVSEGRFTFIDHQKRMFRQGPACPANVAGLIRIPLDPTAVAAILLGDAPLPEGTRAVRVEWDAARGADVLVLDDPSRTTLWLGLRRPNPAVGAWDVVFLEGAAAGAKDRWRVAYEDLETVGSLALPRLVRFAEPGKGFDDGVEIRIRDRVLNPTFVQGAFTLEPPAGYAVELASCGSSTSR
jgi:hypothetical protein